MFLFLVDGFDVPPQHLALSFLSSVDNELLPLGHYYVGPSAATLSALYGAALSIFRRLRVLPRSLNAGTVPPMRFVEALNADAVPLHRRRVPPQYFWTAMAPESFPVHLRNFQWVRGWNILPTMERVQRRDLSPCVCAPEV